MNKIYGTGYPKPPIPHCHEKLAGLVYGDEAIKLRHKIFKDGPAKHPWKQGMYFIHDMDHQMSWMYYYTTDKEMYTDRYISTCSELTWAETVSFDGVNRSKQENPALKYHDMTPETVAFLESISNKYYEDDDEG